MLAKRFIKLISKQLSNHNGKRYACEMCLQIFYYQEKLDEHKELNKDHKAVKTEMPKIHVKIYFKNYKNYLKVGLPFVSYADFEWC